VRACVRARAHGVGSYGKIACSEDERSKGNEGRLETEGGRRLVVGRSVEARSGRASGVWNQGSFMSEREREREREREGRGKRTRL